MEVNLRGSHQLRNAALAIEALRAADIGVPEEAIRAGLGSVEWPARFQELGRFVLDGAHNPHGSAQLAETWREVFGDEKSLVIFGALRDKNYPEMLAALSAVLAAG